MKKYFLAILIPTLNLISPTSVFAVVETITISESQPGGVAANTSTGNLIASALQIVSIIAVLAVLIFLVWGAFDWITSGGDKEKIAGARKKMTNAIIGLFLLALSAFIATLAGEIVGINPFSVGDLPILGQPTAPGTTGTTPVAPRTTP